MYGNKLKGMQSQTQFVWLASPSGITSKNNTFLGMGRWVNGIWPNEVVYTNLELFKTETHQEQGSKYYSGPPIGGIFVTRNSLPAGGDTVTLYWWFTNTETATISPWIDTVSKSGDTTIQVNARTKFTLNLDGPLGQKSYDVEVFVGEQPPSDGPMNYFLKPNFPNPFNGNTIIEIMMPNDGYASIKVFDILGCEIQILAQGMFLRGIHQFRWDAGRVASGVYYCAFTSDSYTQTRGMMVVR
jgi:hypothetical protein